MGFGLGGGRAGTLLQMIDSEAMREPHLQAESAFEITDVVREGGLVAAGLIVEPFEGWFK
jgi:hypothetical protein